MTSRLPASTTLPLRALLEFEESGTVPIRARLAERLGHAMPTVSEAVVKFQQRGLLELGHEDRRLSLTDAGREIAVTALRRHRIVETYLHRRLGLDWSMLHREGELWGQSISPRVTELIESHLGYPSRSPYGTPIPPRDEPLWFPEPAPSLRSVAAARITEESDARYRIDALGEPLQEHSSLLDLLDAAELRPGALCAIGFDPAPAAMQLRNPVNRSLPPVPLPVGAERQIFATRISGPACERAARQRDAAPIEASPSAREIALV